MKIKNQARLIQKETGVTYSKAREIVARLNGYKDAHAMDAANAPVKPVVNDIVSPLTDPKEKHPVRLFRAIGYEPAVVCDNVYRAFRDNPKDELIHFATMHTSCDYEPIGRLANNALNTLQLQSLMLSAKPSMAWLPADGMAMDLEDAVLVDTEAPDEVKGVWLMQSKPIGSRKWDKYLLFPGYTDARLTMAFTALAERYNRLKTLCDTYVAGDKPPVEKFIEVLNDINDPDFEDARRLLTLSAEEDDEATKASRLSYFSSSYASGSIHGVGPDK